ncbi:unnamed protein product [Clonostachys rosea f. rosea IK726]|uniref:Uncharacterized protein n=1 Tax=Clonostachys rosea f. rosea IK726 TaxID=1349383 RepID=A0ACA9UEW0_BIOOC|nr:unnamed protein product [Clonostachys rosea f. rosea IK726]
MRLPQVSRRRQAWDQMALGCHDSLQPDRGFAPQPTPPGRGFQRASHATDARDPQLLLRGDPNPAEYIYMAVLPRARQRVQGPRQTHSNTREIFEELTDNILLPAIQEATSASTDQYYPPSYEAIMADARARREQLQTDQTGSPKQPGNHQEDGEGEPDIYQGIESGRGNRNLSYQIQGQYLEQIWEAIRARTTDHTIFSTMTLYIGAKNTKLLYTRNSAHEAIAEFQRYGGEL